MSTHNIGLMKKYEKTIGKILCIATVTSMPLNQIKRKCLITCDCSLKWGVVRVAFLFLFGKFSELFLENGTLPYIKSNI